MESIKEPWRKQGTGRHSPQIDLAELSLIEWPSDPSRPPRLLGRLRDADLVTEALERLTERSKFLNGYISRALDVEASHEETEHSSQEVCR